MASDRFLVAPFNAGQEDNVKPWLLTDDAFQLLNNLYLFRARIRKRFGARLMQTQNVNPVVESQESRFRVLLGVTDGSGNISGTVPGSIFGIGQTFSVANSSVMFTAITAGVAQPLLSNAPASGTYSTTNGAFSITGLSAGASVYFYPSTPVMGLVSYQQSNNINQITIGFDRNFAYSFSYANGWQRLNSELSPGASVWTGSNSQLFYGTSYRGTFQSDYYLFVTNFNLADVMRYYNGTSWGLFSPIFDNTNPTNSSFVATARIILPYKDRLLLFNTVEAVWDAGTSSYIFTSYTNRCRFSKNGNPLDVDAWYDLPGFSGGFITNAGTKEAIISIQFIKDRLIVFFERSTWELVYTFSETDPFIWQKINTELGVESTFSNVPFDKVVLGIGNVGIHACNGSNVERIDQKIPDFVFNIHNSDSGPERVVGIRDYFAETVYWALPSSDQSDQFPFNNRVLVYNYAAQSWAVNDDSITMFGYFQSSNNQGSTTQQRAYFPSVIAGNQQGFVFILDIDTYTNCQSLQIANMSYSSPLVTLKVIDHNLRFGANGIGSYIKIDKCQGATSLNGNIYPVNTVIDKDTFTISTDTFSGSYTGAGTITLVSNPTLLTKQYNFYKERGFNCSVNKVDMLLSNTSVVGSATTVGYFASSSGIDLVTEGINTDSLVGTGSLDTNAYASVPFESSQSRIWHPVYPMVTGEFIQLSISLTDAQMRDKACSESNFELHSMMFYANPTSSRFQ